MALDYKKKSEYWDQKRKEEIKPRRRSERKRVEVSTSVPKKVLSADEGEKVVLRAKTKYPEMTHKPERQRIQIKKRESRPVAAKRREGFEIVPDAPPVEHDVDPVRAKERRKVSQKRIERQRRIQRSNIRTVFLILIGGIILAALVGSLLAFLRSSFFAITEYSVKGTNYLTASNVLSYLKTDQRTSLLTLDASVVEESLLVNPWIKKATISKRIPSSLEITIEERVPIGIVSMVNEERWVIADDGTWLGKVIEDGEELWAIDPDAVHPRIALEPDSLIIIEDISPTPNTLGTLATSDEVLNAIEVLRGIDASLFEQVQSMSAPEIPLTKIITNEHVEILVGGAKDAYEKSKIALALLKEHEGKVTLIDVRSVDKPTWRGLDTSVEE
ncbi:MAG: FtsQ-type POTRA domain-containing protein [Coriobacteriia bacterium]|nr:FtsQ-type POTRA domain-containing protein [Coriobacteriia bacterium]